MAAPRKDNVKELILDTTENLLENKLLSEISLASIAKAAGISKGTLYYHYKSKNEILFGITDRYLDKQWNDLAAWTENPEKDTSLPRLVKYVIERDLAAPAIRAQLLSDAMTGNEEIRSMLSDRYQMFAKIISEKISERTKTVPADYLSWLILLAADGLFLQKTLQNKNLDTELIIKQTIEYLKQIS
ncbi:MAG: TetR/AcrR family transcriptional regulator [Clostridiales bacterium]|jgi:AcrR family transcriptional regulator|nr:TetR/AcrR family transcriptional regulator [Clostridiales bacterium]